MAGPAENDLGISGIGPAVLVGRGGFGAVYRAEQSDFRRTVAVKVLAAPEQDEVARARFSRECQAMGSLSGHPNIVTLYDAGFLSDERAYLVMGFMEGGSLHEIAYGPDQLTWQEVATIGTKLAGALETAHRAGILHRDLKPANVLISSYGEPQLTDFGIARIAGGHETTSSHITASLPYAPPEVLDGRPPSAASDVYGLAATLLHLITGRAPFTTTDDTSFAPLLRRVYEEDIPDLTTYGVPRALDMVLRQAMAKDQTMRPATAEELGRQIQAAQRSLGVPVGEMVIAGAPREAPIVDDAATLSAGAGAPTWWGATASDSSPPPVPTPPPPVPTPPVPTPPPPIPVPTPPPPVLTPPPVAPTAFASVTPAPPGLITPPPYTAPTPLPTTSTPRSNRTGLIVGGAVAAAAAVVIAILALGGGGGSEPDEETVVAGPTTEAETAVTADTADTEPDPPPTSEPDTASAPTTEPVPTPETATPTPSVPTPTPAPAGDLTLGNSITGALTTGQIASHTFVGTAGQLIELTVASPDGDPTVTLRSPDGTRIGFDDDCATLARETDAQLLTSLPTAGAYTVEVEFIGAGGEYTLSTIADVSPRAGELSYVQLFGVPVSGQFQQTWAIGDGTDLSLVVTDSTGRVIANDDDCFADLDPRIESYTMDPAGTITVNAFSQLPTIAQIGMFGFSSFTATATITAGAGTSFVVDLVAGQTLGAAMTSTDGDSYLSVRDLDGNELVFDDDSAGGLDAQVAYVASADGRYQVVASFIADVAGTFSFAATIS